MESRTIRLVQESFEKVAPLGEKVAEIFYKELFAIEPSLQKMFKGDIKEQGRKLITTLAIVVRSLHMPDQIVGPAQTLAKRHVQYGVQPIHYTYVGNALLRTLKTGLGDQFAGELRDAWIEAYGLLSSVMKDAAYGKQEAVKQTVN